MTLEDALREAAAKGLTHFSLSSHHDGKQVRWQAIASPSTGHRFISEINADPVEAMRVVLRDLPKAKKRAGKTLDLVDESKTQNRKRDVTAAVTAPDEDEDISAPPSKTKNEPETAEDWLPAVTPRRSVKKEK